MKPVEFSQEKGQFLSRDAVSTDSSSIDLFIKYKTLETCKHLLNTHCTMLKRMFLESLIEKR